MKETGVDEIEIIAVDASNLDKVQFFCGHSPTYRRGYDAKKEWVRAHLGKGLRYMLLTVNGYNAGLIEYLPAEHSWRGVEAPGYLLIHCLWVIGRNRGKGYGRLLLERCLADASGTNGVAVVASKAHWLPTPKLFLKNGFEPADHLAPSFDLLVRRLNPNAPLPKFRPSTQPVPKGLTVYHSDQCPYTQNIPAITRQVGAQLRIPFSLVHVRDAAEARAIPCPYGTLAYYYNGEFLTYHPTGSKELLEMLATRIPR